MNKGSRIRDGSSRESAIMYTTNSMSATKNENAFAKFGCLMTEENKNIP